MAWSDEDLRACVARLAEPSDRQLEWLRELGTFPSLDELALEFDDEFARVRAASGCGRSAAGQALLALDEQLARMSGPANADLWTPRALDGEAWSRVRDLARRALVELGD